VNVVLLAVLLLVVVLFVVVVTRFATYRARYRFDDDDLKHARVDAAKRSKTVRGGKAYEHLAPHLPGFIERFDANDARFIGAPIDYLIFDGLGAGELRELVLVEVKTASSRLNRNERQVRDAVEQGRVQYELLRLP
jgi:predicted Holliday junction resolvase-like endonuclease